METKAQRIVLLYDYRGLGLILEYPSGVRYRNQAAGHACWKFEAEGILIPLPLPQDEAPLRALEEQFDSGWENLEEADANDIDQILAAAGLAFITVDRTRLKESYEAWVHVLVSPPDPAGRVDPFQGFEPGPGVLTWENSD